MNVMLLSALLTLSTAALPEATVQKVASRRVLFGHQSVGGNILDGVTDVAGAKLALREGRTAALFEQPGLVHTLIGKNEDPQSKVTDFEAALDATAGKPEIAFFKFCYVDFDAKTNADELFATYLASTQRLQAKYPGVTFVHVTVPLTVVQTGARAWLKHRVLGKLPWGAQENVVRHRFNTLLRTKLEGQPLFDLAALESTRADGTAQAHDLDGRLTPALVPEYSDDGQHLNPEGRRRVAEALLTFLAGLP